VAEAVSNCTRPDGVTGVANINRGHGRLRYSIVDMSMNGGVGKVTLKNRVLISSDPWVGEALTVTIHANNDAYWVVTNRPGTSTMYAVRVDYGWNAAGGVLPAAFLAATWGGGMRLDLAPLISIKRVRELWWPCSEPCLGLLVSDRRTVQSEF
jgi:hypothetical protein